MEQKLSQPECPFKKFLALYISSVLLLTDGLLIRVLNKIAKVQAF